MASVKPCVRPGRTDSVTRMEGVVTDLVVDIVASELVSRTESGSKRIERLSRYWVFARVQVLSNHGDHHTAPTSRDRRGAADRRAVRAERSRAARDRPRARGRPAQHGRVRGDEPGPAE